MRSKITIHNLSSTDFLFSMVNKAIEDKIPGDFELVLKRIIL